MKIKRLAEDVVCKIAAGEVVQSPVNAVKELIENSIDAGAKNISITFDGLKSLHITDDGCGIHKDDFELLCERYCTSKLTRFDDLSNLATFGFRGEALASLSFVSHMTVISKTTNAAVGYSARYSNGHLIAEPLPIAANQGTQIMLEDFFYNMPLRRAAMKSSAEEYQKVLDLIQKYAINRHTIGFSVKKSKSTTFDFVSRSSSSSISTIQAIYGAGLAKELIHIQMNDSKLFCKVEGCMSNANYSIPRRVFILFINDRLVDFPKLKKVLDALYSLYLPKGTSYFMYLSLTLRPETIDVNTHPTKSFVQILNEDDIISMVTSAIKEKLNSVTSSRVIQPLKVPKISSVSTAIPKAESFQTEYDHKKTRVDHRQQKLEQVISHKPPLFTPKKYSTAQSPQAATSIQSIQSSPIFSAGNNIQSFDIDDVINEEYSQLLLKTMNDFSSGIFTDVIQKSVFVGIVDEFNSLLQSGTKLFLCKSVPLIEYFAFHKLLRFFGNFYLLNVTLSFPQDLPPQLMDRLKCIGFEFDSQVITSIPSVFGDYFLKQNDIDQMFQKLLALPNLSLNDIIHAVGQSFCGIDSEKFFRLYFDGLKSHCLVPSDCLIELTNLENIYKIFERC